MKSYLMDTVEGLAAYFKAKRAQEYRLWQKSDAREKLAYAIEQAEESGLKVATKLPKTEPNFARSSDAGDRVKWRVVEALRAIGEHDRVHDATIYFQAPESFYDEDGWGGNHNLGDAAQKAMPWGCNDSESGQGFFYCASHRLQEALDWFEGQGCTGDDLSGNVYAEDKKDDRSMIGVHLS